MQAFERQGGELLLRKFFLLGHRRYWGNLVSEAGGSPLKLLDLQLPVLMCNSRGGALSQQLSRAGIRHIPLLDRLARSICEVISKRCFGRIVGRPEPTIFASSNFRLARDSPGSPESSWSRTSGQNHISRCPGVTYWFSGRSLMDKSGQVIAERPQECSGDSIRSPLEVRALRLTAECSTESYREFGQRLCFRPLSSYFIEQIHAMTFRWHAKCLQQLSRWEASRFVMVR
jgi:hypothetical protein